MILTVRLLYFVLFLNSLLFSRREGSSTHTELCIFPHAMKILLRLSSSLKAGILVFLWSSLEGGVGGSP